MDSLNMLQKLNERIQGLVAWVIVGLVAVTFLFFGIDYYMRANADSDIAVDVNSQSISKQDVELNFRRARQLRDPAGMTAASENKLQQQIIDEMITNLVSVQGARISGFDVTPAQANAAIVKIPQFQQDGHFSADRYQHTLSGALFTPEAFQKEVEQGMLLNQQRFAFIGTSFALPDEIDRFVKLYLQTRDYDYLEIPAKRFLQVSHVPESAILNYYKAHKKEFLSEEQVSVDYIRLAMPDVKSTIKLSEQQVKRYYDDNPTDFQQPSQKQVAHILFKIPADATPEEEKNIKKLAVHTYKELVKNPSQFNVKVQELSDDKSTSAKYGVMSSWIVAGQSELDKELADLTTIGQISPPIKSRYGYEIFKLVASRPATLKSFDAVKSEIETQLLTDLAQAEYARRLEKLSDLTYQTPDSLSSAAEALQLPIEHSKMFSRQGGVDSLAQNKSVISMAFSHDVLGLANNSEPIQIDNDSVVVIRIAKHVPAKEKTYTQVRTLIAQKLADEQAQAQAKQVGDKIIQAAHNIKQQDAILATNNIHWQLVTGAKRDSDKAPGFTNELAFDVPRVGDEIGRSNLSGNYIIIRLKAIHDGELRALDPEQRASITQQIEASYGLIDYDIYVKGLLTQAKIVRK